MLVAAMAFFAILIVDGHEFVRETSASFLRRSSHRVTAVASVSAALALIRVQTFDVVITDMLFEDGDGIDVIRAAKKRHPGTRVVAMSGGGDFLGSGYCLRLGVALGAAAPLLKPFTLSQLTAAVEGSASHAGPGEAAKNIPAVSKKFVDSAGSDEDVAPSSLQGGAAW